MKNIFLTVLSVVLIAAGVACYVNRAALWPVDSPDANAEHLARLQAESDRSNLLFLGSQAGVHDRYPVPLQPIADLNFKTRQEIFQLRTAAVADHPGLSPAAGYVPRRRTFGFIEDGKPWWGIYGDNFYGSGLRSIEGPSVHSVFILNPFLLVGLKPVYPAGSNQEPEANAIFTVAPLELSWEPDQNSAEVRYDVSHYQDYRLRHGSPPGALVVLVAYNASDFGFRFLFPDIEGASNIGLWQDLEIPAELFQFIHCGPSCGYADGCNNMSPNQQDLMLRVFQLPARVKIKLWRERPSSVAQPADMTFTTLME